jgi:DNA-binding beta-propeller fold protein YncE
MRTGSTMRLLGLLCVLLAMLVAGAPSAQAGRPLESKKMVDPSGETSKIPEKEIEGACGVALFSGNIYVSDYYHFAVDVFGEATQVLVQPPAHDRDGPCGLAFDTGGNLYVNYWHESVAKAVPPYSYGAIQIFDSNESTGVAVDQATGNVYVNDRTYVAVYSPTGAPLQQIGAGQLGDAFGVAVFGGKVYVPDAFDNTVKVFEPAVSLTVPTAVIDTPGGFKSLVDAAVAVDPTNGHLVVVDNQQPGFIHPKASIEEFDSSGNYLGPACGTVIDGGPSGLAFSGGSLYVTSGNTEEEKGENVFLFGPYSAAACPPSLESIGEPESSPQPAPAISVAAAAIAPAAAAEPATVRRHRKHKRPHKHGKRHKPAVAKARGRG